MKKEILSVIFVAVLQFLLAGCGEQSQIDSLKQQISELQVQKSELESEIYTLENTVVEKKEENGTAKYTDFGNKTDSLHSENI